MTSGEIVVGGVETKSCRLSTVLLVGGAVYNPRHDATWEMGDGGGDGGGAMAAAAGGGGCVERKITIASDPPGALVYLSDDVEVGRTPVTVPFLWYGDYDVRMRLERMEGTGDAARPVEYYLHTHRVATAPAFQWIGVDLFAELPIEFKDEKLWAFDVPAAGADGRGVGIVGEGVAGGVGDAGGVAERNGGDRGDAAGDATGEAASNAAGDTHRRGRGGKVESRN